MDGALILLLVTCLFSRAHKKGIITFAVVVVVVVVVLTGRIEIMERGKF